MYPKFLVCLTTRNMPSAKKAGKLHSNNSLSWQWQCSIIKQAKLYSYIPEANFLRELKAKSVCSIQFAQNAHKHANTKHTHTYTHIYKANMTAYQRTLRHHPNIVKPSHLRWAIFHPSKWYV